MSLSKEAEEKVLEEARQRFKVAVDYWGAERDLQRDDIKFAAASPDNKAQWPEALVKMRESDPDGPRPCLTINRLPQHINQVVNDHRMNRPRIKVRPEDSKADPDVARIYDGVIRNIEKISKAHVSYTIACQNQVTSGEGYWRVLSRYIDGDSFQQELVIEPILDPLRVYVDPEAQMPDASDAKWIFLLSELPEDEYEEEFGDNEPTDWDGEDSTLWHDRGRKMVVIAEYFTFKDVEKTIYQLEDGRVVDEEMMTESGGKVINQRKASKRQLCWYKMSGTKILDYRETPGKYHTVIRASGNRWLVDGKMQISGLVRNSKDAARSYNYWASVLVERLALQSKAPVVGYAGQFEGHEKKWATSNVRNYAYLEVNAITDQTGGTLPLPQRMISSPDISATVQAMMLASDDMKTVTGQYNASLGQQSNETSGKAIMARQREGDVGSFHYVDNINDAILQTGRVLVDLIPHYYDTAQILSIIGEDDKPSRAAIDPNQPMPVRTVHDEMGNYVGKAYNLNLGRYDVDIQIGPGFETKRQEMLSGMSEMVKGNPALWQIMGDWMVRAMDWPGSDKMADRLKVTLLPEIQAMESEENPLPPEVAAQIAAAQAQMQQQQAMMQEQGAQIQQAQEQVAGEVHKAQMAKKDVEIAMAKLEVEKQTLTFLKQLVDARTAEQAVKIENDKLQLMNDLDNLMKETEPEKEDDTDDGVTKALEQQMAEQAKVVADLEKRLAEMAPKPKIVTIKTPEGKAYTGSSVPNGNGSEITISTPTGDVYVGNIH